MTLCGRGSDNFKAFDCFFKLNNNQMRIPFKQLIAEYNQTAPVKLNKNRLADEMVRAGVFKSKNSALAMMWYNESGKNKSIDDELYKFTLAKFNKKGSEILID
jgi:hypothetical protein